MDTKAADMLYDTIKAFFKKKTSSYDSVATVARIEGNTAWVHIPGGVPETPVKLTVSARPGDLVQIRVGGSKAWITGNASAPPTDDTKAKEAIKSVNIVQKSVAIVKETVERVGRIAGNTAQYFWFTETGTDTGAHITEVPKDEFLADPENGGGNLLARSNGIAVRDGLTELSVFGANGTIIGQADENHIEINTDGVLFKKGATEHASIRLDDYNSHIRLEAPSSNYWYSQFFPTGWRMVADGSKVEAESSVPLEIYMTDSTYAGGATEKLFSITKSFGKVKYVAGTAKNLSANQDSYTNMVSMSLDEGSWILVARGIFFNSGTTGPASTTIRIADANGNTINGGENRTWQGGPNYVIMNAMTVARVEANQAPYSVTVRMSSSEARTDCTANIYAMRIA